MQQTHKRLKFSLPKDSDLLSWKNLIKEIVHLEVQVRKKDAPEIKDKPETKDQSQVVNTDASKSAGQRN